MFLHPQQLSRRALSFPTILSVLFLITGPAFSKKINNSKVLSEAARSCREIDAKVKSGAFHGTYWVQGEGDNGSWTPYGSKDAAEKANPRGFWKGAWVYQDEERVWLVEMEIKTPTKEWIQKVAYYFRPDGSLQKAHSEFRTFGAYERKQGPEHQFLARVLRDRFYDGKGKCIKRSPPRISDATNHREVRDVVFTDGVWPLYPKVSSLPFPVVTGPKDPSKK